MSVQQDRYCPECLKEQDEQAISKGRCKCGYRYLIDELLTKKQVRNITDELRYNSEYDLNERD